MNKRTLKRLSQVALSASIVLVVSSCSKTAPQNSTTEVSAVNLRTNAVAMNEMITGYRVMRNDNLKASVDGDTLLSASSGDATQFLKTSPLVDERTLYKGQFPTEDTPAIQTDAANDTLMVGLPIGSLGEERILGGVITKVSAHENESLGSLKLSDFPMLHGKLMLAGLDTKAPQLLFVGCASKCKESSPRLPLIAFPISAVDTKSALLMIDLSAVGRSLDLLAMLDPTGEGTGLKSVSSVATTFDASAQTIVFDIDSIMKAVDPENAPLPDTTITVRWYLKSSAAFDSAFVARPQTDGVGFFTTDTAADAKIKRWSMARFGEAGVKYYIKHVPSEWQPSFAQAFDAWNKTFQDSFGRKIFDYEFIPENDARNELLVPGDIRYNILEWDLINRASYGGLGPSEGNNYTGEIINANVLIQGPNVISLYSAWFKVSAQATALRAMGKSEEAARLLKGFTLEAEAALKPAVQQRLTLNKKDFVIHAQRPELADPHTQRNDFEELPPNVDFKSYMTGYFFDMVTHELGHNLGLRHNFRGNMGATDTGEKGSTSRSVMEYLGRRYRYLDQVGDYDLMAIKYGYAAVVPTHLDWFCTDENKWAPKTKGASPECSSDDATSDPYTYFEFRLARSIDYLTARGESYAPVWTQANLKRELTAALNGLLSYASVEPGVAEKLSNFFGKPGRPSDSKLMQTYVVNRVKQQLCDPNLDFVIAGKYDPAAKALTIKQIQELRETTSKVFAEGGVNLGIDVNCNPVATIIATVL